MEERYQTERAVLAKKITAEEYAHPENQVKSQSTAVNKAQTPGKAGVVESKTENLNQLRNTVVAEKKVPVETNEEEKIKLEKKDKEYQIQYDDKRERLIRLKQSNFDSFSKQFSDFSDTHIRLFGGTHTAEFLDKQSQFEEIKKEFNNGIQSVNDDFKSAVNSLIKLENKISNFVTENKNFLDEQGPIQVKQFQDRQKRFKELNQNYLKEKDSFHSKINQLTEFSNKLNEFIQVSEGDGIVANLQNKKETIQIEMEKNEDEFSKFPKDLYENMKVMSEDVIINSLVLISLN